jgi:hypothetical protein
MIYSNKKKKQTNKQTTTKQNYNTDAEAFCCAHHDADNWEWGHFW